MTNKEPKVDCKGCQGKGFVEVIGLGKIPCTCTLDLTPTTDPER